MTRPADVGARAAAGQRADLEPPGGGPAWDLLVIGGGTAGIVAAKTAAGFGASVLLVERDRDRLLQSRAAVTTFLVVAKAPMTRFGRIVAELAPRPGR